MFFLIQKWRIILKIEISHKSTGKILIMTIPFFWQFTIILVGSNSYAIELHLRASFMIVHCFLSTLTTKLINISIPIKLWKFSLPDNRHLWYLIECCLFPQVQLFSKYDCSPRNSLSELTWFGLLSSVFSGIGKQIGLVKELVSVSKLLFLQIGKVIPCRSFEVCLFFDW